MAHQLSDHELLQHRDLADALAHQSGDTATWQQSWPSHKVPAVELSGAAYQRAHLAACTALLEVDPTRQATVLERIHLPHT